jgi:tetratricopeptide (TPR) repeat protein/V8-like Glu-specific endopeptidase
MLGCGLVKDTYLNRDRSNRSRFKYFIALTIGLASIGLFPQVSFGLSAAEVAKIAKSTAVTISSDSSHGSGIIIQQQGNQYLVLTAAHVVRNNRQNYQIVTADDRSYRLQPTAIQPLAGVDLAVVKFTSDRRYPVPKMGNANESTEGTVIYVSGYPMSTEAIDRSIFNFTDGKVTANSSKPLKDGYSLIYSNNTLPGMSGGGVFNDKGELVAIHGRGDVDTKITSSEINPDIRVKTGFNLGIPINTFQQLASKIGLNSIATNRAAESTVASNNKSRIKADDFILAGFDRLDKKDFAGSAKEFTKALEINPNLFVARFWRGSCSLLIGDTRTAIADLTRAIELNPKKVEAYMYRGSAYAKLGNRQLALADLDKALALAPNSAIGYGNRCSLKFQLRDFKGAIDDCTRAIKIEPFDRYNYSSRGAAYYQLDRYKEAIADHNISIKIDSQNPLGYLSRGLARDGDGDRNGAIADYGIALKLTTQPQLLGAIYSARGQSYMRAKNRVAAISDFNASLQQVPNDAEIHFFRGNTYYENGNRSAAMADLSRSIQLDPKSAPTYLLRGVVRTENNEAKPAIEDFNTALKLDPQLAAIALANRGVAKMQLADRRGAIADFDRAISLDKEVPKAYYNRGLLRAQSGNKSGAIADLQAAAALYLKSNNKEKYQQTIAKIAELNGNKKNIR